MQTSADEAGTEPVLHFAASLQSPLAAAFHESVQVPAARAVPVPETTIASVAINATDSTIFNAEPSARATCELMSSILLILGSGCQRAFSDLAMLNQL